MKISLQLQDLGLLPYDDDAVKFMSKKAENSIFVVDVKDSRNPRYHKRALKMLRIMHDMIETDYEFEPWRKMLTILAGYRDEIAEVSTDGTTKVYCSPQSISFENMEDEEFKAWFTAVHAAFCRKFGDLLTIDQLNEWASI